MSIVRAIVSTLQIIGELFASLWHLKRLWIAPLIVILVVFGLLILLASSPAIAPFIYTLL